MDDFDFVIIGAGAAGEAAAFRALARGAPCRDRRAGPLRRLVPVLGLPAVEDAAPRGRDPRPRRRLPVDARRRPARLDDQPRGDPLPQRRRPRHRGSTEAGAEVVRGDARVAGPGPCGSGWPAAASAQLRGRFLVVAVGTHGAVPDHPGPRRRGGLVEPRGDERARPAAQPRRPGVRPERRRARPGLRPLRRARRRSSPAGASTRRTTPGTATALAAGLTRDGVDVRLGVEPVAVEAGGRAGWRPPRPPVRRQRRATGHEILLAVGRVAPLDGLGLESIGVVLRDGRVRPDDRLRIADDVFVAGDPAGPEMHTHLAHYQGEMVARIALGDDVRPDFRAIPRATYTDPETAGVGMTVRGGRARRPRRLRGDDRPRDQREGLRRGRHRPLHRRRGSRLADARGRLHRRPRRVGGDPPRGAGRQDPHAARRSSPTRSPRSRPRAGSSAPPSRRRSPPSRDDRTQAGAHTAASSSGSRRRPARAAPARMITRRAAVSRATVDRIPSRRAQAASRAGGEGSAVGTR